MSTAPPRGPLIVLLSCIALLACACATNPVSGERELVMMSEADEIRLGADFHERLLEQIRPYDDPALQRYVDRIGQRLAAQSHRPGLDYHFTVLDDPAVNAFALPGGYVYVNRGILAYFDSEAALAGVLGHEIGHVTARHAVQRHSTAMVTGVLAGALLSGSDSGQAGADLVQVIRLAAVRGYGRDQELEADRLGAQYLARAGYDSAGMLDVIGILADQEAFAAARARARGGEPQGYHGVFATHPDNDARVQRVVRAARRYQAPEPRADGHAEYLRMIDGMAFGPRRQRLLVAGRVFLHRALDTRIAVPAGWTIDNRPERLVLQGPVDGLEISVELRQLGDDELHFPQRLMEQRLGSNEPRRSGPVSTDRYAGWAAVTAASGSSGRVNALHVVMLKRSQAWFFRGASDAEHFEQLARALFAAAGSLRRLTDAERRLLRPLRIHVVAARRGETYADIAADAPDHLLDPVVHLRLLNGDYPYGEPAAGRLVKTLR